MYRRNAVSQAKFGRALWEELELTIALSAVNALSPNRGSPADGPINLVVLADPAGHVRWSVG